MRTSSPVPPARPRTRRRSPNRCPGRALFRIAALAILSWLPALAAPVPVPIPAPVLAATAAAAAPPASPAGREALLVALDGAVTPVSARNIVETIEEAEEEGAALVLLRIDTPGGLDASMREAVKSILASRVPVVAWVGPPGARAASAGVFLVLAAHVAAMAPGTNVGAAHPVGIGGGSPDSTMSAKVENDAVAYIRSIATERGRNADWAEQAVRQSVSVEAEEALRLGVIDRISPDLRSLLVAIDGTVVETAAGPETLRTGDLPVRERKKSVADRILGVISDPNIAYLLFLAGILGIFFELSNPGAVLPGIIGGISIILALFAFQTLSVNFAGVLLILLALILFIAEVKVASSGALAIGGALSLLLGSLMLFRRAGGGLGVSLKTIIPAVVITTGLFFFAIVMAWRAQRRRPQTGTEGMIGELATVVEDLRLEGRVFLHGEIWTAVATTPVPKGGKVRVLAVEGLRLRVESIEGGTPAREV